MSESDSTRKAILSAVRGVAVGVLGLQLTLVGLLDGSSFLLVLAGFVLCVAGATRASSTTPE